MRKLPALSCSTIQVRWRVPRYPQPVCDGPHTSHTPSRMVHSIARVLLIPLSHARHVILDWVVSGYRDKRIDETNPSRRYCYCTAPYVRSDTTVWTRPCTDRFFFLLLSCTYCTYAPAMLMDGGELVTRDCPSLSLTPFCYNLFHLDCWGGLLFDGVRRTIIRDPTCLVFFCSGPDRIYGQTKRHRQKSPSVIFGRTNIYTERCPISIDTKNKTVLSVAHNRRHAMTQTGYTRANIREIHVYAMAKINKMRVLFVFHPKWHCGWSDKCNNGIVRNRL